MSSILAIVAETPPTLEGRSLFRPGVVMERWALPGRALRRCGTQRFDLIVLAEFTGEALGEVAQELRGNPRWRTAPVLYLLLPEEPGFVIPATFRPESDFILKGRFASPEAARRMEELVRAQTPSHRLLAFGDTELDPTRGRLRHGDAEVRLTRQEAALTASLLQAANRVVPLAELARSAGRQGGQSDSQVVRRHVSNIRRKLAEADLPVAVRTVRGVGYQLVLPRTGGS